MTRKLREDALFIFLIIIMLAWGPTAAAAAEAEGRLTLKGAIDIALKEHPSLKESQEKVAAARSQIGVSRAAFFPQVSLLSNYYYGDAFPSTGRGGTPRPGRMASSFPPR